MKKQIELMQCRCGKDKIFEDSATRGVLYRHIIGCVNLDCDIGAVSELGFTQESARRRTIKSWNKMASKQR